MVPTRSSMENPNPRARFALQVGVVAWTLFVFSTLLVYSPLSPQFYAARPVPLIVWVGIGAYLISIVLAIIGAMTSTIGLLGGERGRGPNVAFLINVPIVGLFVSLFVFGLLMGY